ncbi:hypothetical protein GCM10009809_31840 [Isoptericola hypogeus]|uniref:Uncharacterized protein n=1 Tax=Isoptericola hypogeus TaxID=300179 RepID=A0ABN2JNZ0_9MICO
MTYSKYADVAAEIDENPAAAGPVRGWCDPTFTVSSSMPGLAAAGLLHAAAVRPTPTAQAAAEARVARERAAGVGV